MWQSYVSAPITTLTDNYASTDAMTLQATLTTKRQTVLKSVRVTFFGAGPAYFVLLARPTTVAASGGSGDEALQLVEGWLAGLTPTVGTITTDNDPTTLGWNGEIPLVDANTSRSLDWVIQVICLNASGASVTYRVSATVKDD